MEAKIVWKEGMLFDGQAGGHHVDMDVKAPLGKDLGPSPKELVLMGLLGCTGMDVRALLKKYKQTVDTFEVSASANLSQGTYPMVFTSIEILFQITGEVDPERALEAVNLSQNKFCGVTAMLVKAVPISWKLMINGKEAGTGEPHFD